MRLRDLGAIPGRLPTGAKNAITDVPGVRVGHVTRIEGEGKLVEGTGPIRTGVTAILPHTGNLYDDKVSGGVCSINGFGKATGFEQIRTRGQIETPILLTNTLAISRTADAVIGYMLETNPGIGLTSGTVNPVVGECFDGFLNDTRGRHIHAEHVRHAIMSASDDVQEGCVGAGTGTSAFGFKGGIGTSSRAVDGGTYTVGALVQSNYGIRAELTIMGAPIGKHLLHGYLPVAGEGSQQGYVKEQAPTLKDTEGGGSIMMVIATDAPLDSRQLTRMAMRAAFGLARTGTISHDSSGDFVIAFSTTHRWAHQTERRIEVVNRVPEGSPVMNQLFQAVVEAIEEAILNSLVAARTMIGRDGNTLYALPHEVLIERLKHHRIIE